MTFRPLLAAAVLAALFAGAARSENLLEVYQDAMRSDPLLREAEARREAALEAKPQARGLLLPQVDVTGQYATRNSSGETIFNQRFDPDNDPSTPAVVLPVPNKQETDSDFWNYTAELRQPLFRWDYWQGLKRANADVAVAEATFRAAQQNLLVRVSRAYFDVLAAEDTLAAAQATREAVMRQLEQAEKRFEVGLIAITDVQEARAANDNATASVIVAKRAVASAREALRELTGEEYAALVKPADQMPLDQPRPAEEQVWVDRARESNLDVVAARLSVDVAAADVRVAQAGHFPSLELFATRNEYDQSATQTNNGLTGPADANQTQDTFGVQLTVPIFSGGVTQSRVRQQVALQRAAREKLEGSLRAAERETRDAYLGVLAEKARVQALQQAVRSSQTALEATEAGFDVGTRTTVDVLEARRRLFEAQRDYARSRYEYLTNIVRLEAAAGGLQSDDLTMINGYLTQPAPSPQVRPQN